MGQYLFGTAGMGLGEFTAV